MIIVLVQLHEIRNVSYPPFLIHPKLLDESGGLVRKWPTSTLIDNTLVLKFLGQKGQSLTVEASLNKLPTGVNPILT